MYYKVEENKLISIYDEDESNYSMTFDNNNIYFSIYVTTFNNEKFFYTIQFGKINSLLNKQLFFNIITRLMIYNA